MRWDLADGALSYYEDLFAKDAGTPVVVNVASKAYRAVSFIHSFFLFGPCTDLNIMFSSLSPRYFRDQTLSITYCLVLTGFFY